MTALTSLQSGQTNGRLELERKRMLADERKREEKRFAQQEAQAKGLSVGVFNARKQEKITLYRQRLAEIDRASDVFYVVLILAAFFKSALTIITIIPVIGFAFSLVVSLLLMILNVILLFAARSVEPVKVHNHFYVRLLVLLMMYILDTLLPFLTFFIPIALMSSIVIYLLVKRDRRREKKRIEGELSKLGAILTA